MPRIEPVIVISKEEYEASNARSVLLEKLISGQSKRMKNLVQYYIEWEKSVQRIMRERGVLNETTK